MCAVQRSGEVETTEAPLPSRRGPCAMIAPDAPGRLPTPVREGGAALSPIMLVRVPTSPPPAPDVAGRGELGDACYILSARNRTHFYSGGGTLSIKSFSNGRALYDVGTGRYAVDDRCYLVLNDRQEYTLTIDLDEPIESFCLFFAPGFAESVRRRMVSSPVDLIDDPAVVESPVAFFERIYPHDDILSPALFALRAALPTMHGDVLWIEERLHDIVERLLSVHRDAAREASSLSAVRASTREEIYRRLYRARDFAAACFHESVTLGDMARAACLSPNHLLRTFNCLFGQTPHQFLTDLRLDYACRLLETTDSPVTDVCFTVGYTSLGSFSSLFRRRFGVSPEQYRRAKNSDFREAEPVAGLA